MIAWPEGAELAEDGRTVDLPDGTSVPHGASVVGMARGVPVDRMPGGPDGYWSSIAGFCGVREIMVLDSLRVAAAGTGTEGSGS